MYPVPHESSLGLWFSPPLIPLERPRTARDAWQLFLFFSPEYWLCSLSGELVGWEMKESKKESEQIAHRAVSDHDSSHLKLRCRTAE